LGHLGLARRGHKKPLFHHMGNILRGQAQAGRPGNKLFDRLVAVKHDEGGALSRRKQ
jgi:hypothetical protein